MSGRYALLVSINHYADGTLSQLTAPGGDANALAEILGNDEIGAFDKVDVLSDAPADRVRREVARFFADRSPDDLLMLYFTGHGIRDDEGHLFLAQSDTECEFLSATAIPASFVTSEMDRSRSRRIALFLDCCHSGAFAHGAKAAGAAALGANVGTGQIFEGNGFGRVILTASDKTQYAWEGEEIEGEAALSIFTRHIVEGLSSGRADVNGDGLITVDELYDYVYERVLEENSKQTPQKWTYQQQGELLIARNPNAQDPMEVLPEPIVEALNSDLAGIRAGGVKELGRLLSDPEPSIVRAAETVLNRLVDEEDSRQVHEEAVRVLAEHRGEPAPKPKPQKPPQPCRPEVEPEKPKPEPAADDEKPAPTPEEPGKWKLRQRLIFNTLVLAIGVGYGVVFGLVGEGMGLSANFDKGETLTYCLVALAPPAIMLRFALQAARTKGRARFGPVHRYVLLISSILAAVFPVFVIFAVLFG